jgi:metallo-beta-lactamase class B
MKQNLLLFIALILSIWTSAQKDSSRLIITPLTGDFYIYTTFNEYKGSLFPANGMYLVSDEGVLLIDTPWDTTQFQPLLDSIYLKHQQKVILCIATHSHEDRTAGLKYYTEKGIKTYTSHQTDSILNRYNEARATFTFTKDTVFNLGQYSFQTFYGGPGHTPDNIVIWFENQKILYGGCLIKSLEANNLGYLVDAVPESWGSTLELIMNTFGQANFVIPGHQSWENPLSVQHTQKLVELFLSKTKE